jgi:hypothetical protein
MKVHPNSRHVFKLEPTTLAHVTDAGLNCWCEPVAWQPCSECPSAGAESKNCYKCGNGPHPGLHPVEMGFTGALVIIHNDR